MAAEMVAEMEAVMAGNGAKKTTKKGVHAHERNMHPGKPLTKMPWNGNGKKNGNGRNGNRKR
jgi:hypothetical protein